MVEETLAMFKGDEGEGVVEDVLSMIYGGKLGAALMSVLSFYALSTWIDTGLYRRDGVQILSVKKAVLNTTIAIIKQKDGDLLL